MVDADIAQKMFTAIDTYVREYEGATFVTQEGEAVLTGYRLYSDALPVLCFMKDEDTHLVPVIDWEYIKDALMYYGISLKEPDPTEKLTAVLEAILTTLKAAK